MDNVWKTYGKHLFSKDLEVQDVGGRSLLFCWLPSSMCMGLMLTEAPITEALVLKDSTGGFLWWQTCVPLHTLSSCNHKNLVHQEVGGRKIGFHRLPYLIRRKALLNLKRLRQFLTKSRAKPLRYTTTFVKQFSRKPFFI
jgi:hypothetical protein